MTADAVALDLLRRRADVEAYLYEHAERQVPLPLEAI
jgi:hypothetical protein